MRRDSFRISIPLFTTTAACYLLTSLPAIAQDAEPAELPPVEVTAQQKKKTSSAKKKTTPPPSAPEPVEPQPVSAPPESDIDPLGDLSSSGGVDGYRATRSATATKTDTPLKNVPQSIQVIPKELAKDQGTRDLRKALSYIPGVVVGQGEGHRDAPTIRGVSTTADFFTDGVRDDVQYFRDLYNIDRVEVLKGPNAMIFGRGGGGGVINRVTKKAEGERLYELTTTYGSFDTKRTEIDAGQAITNDFAFRILGMYEDSGSYRDFTDLERYGINPKIMFRPDDNTKVYLAYEYYHNDGTVDRGIPGDSRTGKPAKVDESTYFGNPNDSYTTFDSHVATAVIEHKFDNGIYFKNHTQYGDYDKYYQNITANETVQADGTLQLGAYGNQTDRQNIFNQTDVSLRLNMAHGIRHTILAGTEFGYQETDNQRMPGSGRVNACVATLSNTLCSDTFASLGVPKGPVNHTELTLAGVYVQDQIEIGRHIEIIGGIRFDRFDLDYSSSTGDSRGRVDDVWSPRVGVVFKPTEQLSFYASYSETFLPFSGEQFATLSAANANLAPEEFINREVGFKWDIAPRLAFTGALFMLDRENQVVSTGPGTSAQIGRTRTEGGELTLTGNLTDDWEVVAGYGYQVAEVKVGPNKGQEIALVPHHTFSLWNKYRFLPNWAAGLGVVSRSEAFAELDNQITLPGFARLDAALFWDINENLKAQLNVENVLGTDYYSTAHNNENITPGSPRAFFATITSKF